MSTIKGFCCDDETGEILTYDVNDETGEPFVEILCPPVFREPCNLEINTSMSSEKYMKFPKGYLTKTKKFQSLKENIIAGSNTISWRMLLIPTVIIFPSILCAILMVLEIYLHVRCHKKNKKLNDATMYYRSPFHVVTSIFCGVCRESDSASKVGQLQDKRHHHYGYFRGLTI